MKSQVTHLIATIVVGTLLCACATTPSAGLSALKTEQVQRLAMTCYLEHHDTGAITNGYGPVWLACKDWAQSQVRSGPVLTATTPK